MTTPQLIDTIPNSRTQRAVQAVYDGLNADVSALDFVNPSGGQDYFVDGNVSVAGDGTSWASPYKTLAAAIAASNISIALTTNRWWARRNRIFFAADVLTETLTAFPTKCDIIGVGSYDGNTKPGLTGHHNPATESYGTRWFNVQFNAVATATAIMTLAGATSVAGPQFHGCTFNATAGTVTSAILATAVPGLQVIGCEFIGTFATSYITFGTGEAGRTLIKGNRMIGTSAIGIVAGAGMTSTWGVQIDDNFIHATGLVVDDDSDLIFGTRNTMITDADAGVDALGAMDVNKSFWSNNKLTGIAGTEENADFPFAVQFTS